MGGSRYLPSDIVPRFDLSTQWCARTLSTRPKSSSPMRAFAATMDVCSQIVQSDALAARRVVALRLNAAANQEPTCYVSAALPAVASHPQPALKVKTNVVVKSLALPFLATMKCHACWRVAFLIATLNAAAVRI